MYNPGNSILAIVALVLWVPITVALFMRLRPAAAATYSIVGGALFLPEAVQILLPFFPDLDKSSIPVLTSLACCAFKARHKLAAAKPYRGVDVLALLLAGGEIGTWLTNRDSLVTKWNYLAGPLTGYAAFSSVLFVLVVVYGMFYAGRALITRSRDVVEVLRATFVLGVIYTVPCLIEIRFSPQLHTWIYGFMQHEFIQTIRGGGFRPMVFTTHGLVLTRFMAVACLSGIMLWRLNALRGAWTWAVPWTIVVFIACKSTGAIVLFILFAPFVAFAAQKTQARVVFMVAAFVLAYPVVTGGELLPIDKLTDLASAVSPQRAESLFVRFDNEARLLERANERFWFGWGGYNRHQLYNEWGNQLFVVDGEWVGRFVARGFVGFVGYYGFYLLPLFMAARRIRAMHSSEHALLLGGFALCSALLVLDTVPNSSGTLPHFFWSGALLGALKGLSREDDALRERAREARRRRRNPIPDADPAAA